MLFASDYSFRGNHADKVKQLVTTKFDKEHSLFERNMDVYLLAPIVGFLYGRRVELDKSTANTTNILAEIMLKYQKELEFTYRLIMLLDKDYESDFEKRVNKAFRDYGDAKSSPDLERYDEYVRGGVEVLYEKLWETSKMPDDYVNNLYDFMDDFESRYGQSADEIIDLCRLTRS